jgi:hypothetical protein
MTLDAKFQDHVKKKSDELELRYKKMYWLIGRDSSLSLHNKLLIYKQILRPVWTYGIQLWGCSKHSNTEIIQRFQNKVLRNMVNAPWYIRNNDLHRDLLVNFVSSEIQRFAQKHEELLHHHVNIEAIQLLENLDIVRRLQRKKPF